MAKIPTSTPPEPRNPLEPLKIFGIEAIKGGTPPFIVWAGIAIIAITLSAIPSFFAAHCPAGAAATIGAAFRRHRPPRLARDQESFDHSASIPMEGGAATDTK